jgi:hypothetical protein
MYLRHFSLTHMYVCASIFIISYSRNIHRDLFVAGMLKLRYKNSLFLIDF